LRLHAQWLGIACDVGNGGRVGPANVPNNAGISTVHGGQNFGHPFVANISGMTQNGFSM
jgi:hypothetical protein